MLLKQGAEVPEHREGYLRKNRSSGRRPRKGKRKRNPNPTDQRKAQEHNRQKHQRPARRATATSRPKRARQESLECGPTSLPRGSWDVMPEATQKPGHSFRMFSGSWVGSPSVRPDKPRACRSGPAPVPGPQQECQSPCQARETPWSISAKYAATSDQTCTAAAATTAQKLTPQRLGRSLLPLPQQLARMTPQRLRNNEPKSQNTQGTEREGLWLAALVVRLQFHAAPDCGGRQATAFITKSPTALSVP